MKTIKCMSALSRPDEHSLVSSWGAVTSSAMMCPSRLSYDVDCSLGNKAVILRHTSTSKDDNMDNITHKDDMLNWNKMFHVHQIHLVSLVLHGHKPKLTVE